MYGTAGMLARADDVLLHGPEAARPFEPLEVPVPTAATGDGVLTVTFSRGPGVSGGRVAEVWLVGADPGTALPQRRATGPRASTAAPGRSVR